jgi:hypothetical protein
LYLWHILRNESGGEFDELFPVHSINIIAYKLYSLFKAAPYHNAIVFDFDAANYFGFAIAVCAEPKLPLAPKVTLTAAFIGGYGLLVDRL